MARPRSAGPYNGGRSPIILDGMPSELSKTYDPAAVHAEVAAVWEAERCFHAEPTDPGEPYSIVIPPPNVTAALHLGHALNNTIQDILIRRARMQGKNAVWLPGTDHASIATHAVVERRLLKEEGKRRTDYKRDEFIAKVQAWKDEYEAVILGQLRAIGCSCDWERTAFTMDEPRSRGVREAFFQLFKAGLIYRGKRLVNWDPASQTSLADDEVENEEVDGFFYYLRYPICDAEGNFSSPPPLAGEESYLTVATTRPETMLGDTAIAVNPTDPRAAALRGKFVKLPIVNRIIPIIEDDYVVKPVAFGGDPSDIKAQMATGFLKVTPAHDPNDYDIGQRHKLPVINIMAPDGSISDKHGWADGVGDAGFLLGKSRETAREEVVEWFRRHGLLEDVKPYRHSVGHSYRSHVPIEPYLSDQWYCKVTDDRLRGAALRALSPGQAGMPSSPSPLAGEGGVRGSSAPGRATEPTLQVPGDPSPHRLPQGEGETITFYPARYAKTYQTWHENIRDWCISRQLWWGHRIPVWTVSDSFNRQNGRGEMEDELWLKRLQEKGLLWEIDPPKSHPEKERFITGGQSRYVCIRDTDDPEIQQFFSGPGYDWVQDPDVLDTWFSSALWPMSTLGWPADTVAEATTPRDAELEENRKSHIADCTTRDNRKSQMADRESTPELAKWNPTTVLTTAREIITLWVSRMVMFNEFFLGQIPFKDVFIHAMIQDGDGRKMSKSLGNGVDPLDIIHSHGADAMRFTLASMCTQTQDVRMPVIKDEATGRNTSPKFDLGRNFANKLWNAARFVLAQISTGQNSLSANSAAAASPAMLSFADRWILSRLNRTIAEINEAIESYRFDVYAKSLYDFFWRDFCDWYVENAKPQMKDDARRAATAAVLATVLDSSLRLLHPATPFITEKLWWNLNEIAPHRHAAPKLPGIGELPAAKRLIKAAWPTPGEYDVEAERAFAFVQEVVTQLRNLRSTYKVEPKRTIDFLINCHGDAETAILQHAAAIEMLTASVLIGVNKPSLEPADATRVSANGIELIVIDLVDEGAEQLRIARRRDELTKAVTALRGRLGNAGYLAKAPPNLVKQTQDQLAEATAELSQLG